MVLIVVSCKQTNDESIQISKNYLDNNLSLKLENENIQTFFNQHKLDISLTNTENVNPYRIFLHEFNASENQIAQLINILELESVTQKDFFEIHMNKYVNADFQIHSSIGLDYIKNPAILFYKEKIGNETAQKELKVSKVYLYYNKENKKTCFQVYYEWG